MMKFFYILFFVLQASSVWAELWQSQTSGPTGDTQVLQWDVRHMESSGGSRTQFFLKGDQRPLFVVSEKTDETKVEFSSGMSRHFAPGFLVLTDLPLPFVIPSFSGNQWRRGRYCSEERTGETVFKTCVDIIVVSSLEEAASVSLLPGEVVLVQDRGGLKALIGSDFRVERQ